MNKLNPLGNELLELKRELIQSHSSIVVKSLNQLADQLLAQQMIDAVTFSYLKDPNQTLESFKSYCLTQSNFCLDTETLLKIYDQKRLALVDYLNQSVEAFDLTSKSFLKEEEVVIVKSFSFDRNMACEFFGIDERFCENLYGRKRFVERFVVLRYKKLLNEFIQTYPLGQAPFKIDRTPVFFDETTEAYTIEFLIKFKLEALEDLEEKNFIEEVHQLMSNLIRYMEDSMGMNVSISGQTLAPTSMVSQPQVTTSHESTVSSVPLATDASSSSIASTNNLTTRSLQKEEATHSIAKQSPRSEVMPELQLKSATKSEEIMNPSVQSVVSDGIDEIEIENSSMIDIENELDLQSPEELIDLENLI